MSIDEYRALQSKVKRRPMQTEHAIQVACVSWFRAEYPQFLILALPNAAQRSERMGRWMKDEGLLPGAADLIVIIHNDILFVEMKTAKGRQQETQKAFQKRVEKLGFGYIVCHSTEEFELKIRRWIHARYE